MNIAINVLYNKISIAVINLIRLIINGGKLVQVLNFIS